MAKRKITIEEVINMINEFKIENKHIILNGDYGKGFKEGTDIMIKELKEKLSALLHNGK